MHADFWFLFKTNFEGDNNNRAFFQGNLEMQNN